MRNSSSKLATVLTALLTLTLTLQLTAQQTSPPTTENTSPADSHTPAVQPDPDQPAHVGGSIKPPRLLYAATPTYSESARQAHFSGQVQVYCWIDEQGNTSHVRVVHGVGMGLDEKAVESVRLYKFKPAMQNGKPVKVDLYINVNFDSH
jgi:TonB family protein